jgi:hypothetical protein
MMNIQDEVDERVSVVHPAQVQDDRRMEVAKPVLESLEDGGDKDSECGDEDRRRLILDRVELLGVHHAVHECVERGNEAEDVLRIYGCADADARDVRVG